MRRLCHTTQKLFLRKEIIQTLTAFDLEGAVGGGLDTASRMDAGTTANTTAAELLPSGCA